MIDSYSFGRMVIDGQTYTADLIIFPERIESSWWRITGHRLCLKDIEEVLNEEPKVIIIGTGFAGLMKVEDEVKQHTQSKGISLFIDKTKNAVKKFNEISAQKKTIGAFHLTC